MRINLLKKKRSLNHDNEDEWRSATFGQLQSTALPNWLLFSKLQIWKTQQGNLLSRSRRFFLFCLKVLHFIGEHYMDFVVNYIAVYFHGIALNIECKHDDVPAKEWCCDPDGHLGLVFVWVHFNVALCYIVLHCIESYDSLPNQVPLFFTPHLTINISPTSSILPCHTF